MGEAGSVNIVMLCWLADAERIPKSMSNKRVNHAWLLLFISLPANHLECVWYA